LNITDILEKDAIVARLHGSTREEVLSEIAQQMATAYPAAKLKAEEIYHLLTERERVSSTGIGDGLAIPHARVSGLPRFFAALGISKTGIDFGAADAKPTHIFVVLLTPEGAAREHLSTLARICRLFKRTAVRDELSQKESSAAIFDAMQKQEALLSHQP
jgi:PTS system nitrogen regulatory IIA component